MNRWSGRLLMTLLVLLAFSGAAHADLITPWTYSWSRSPLSVAADNNGTGGVSLTLVPMTGNQMTGNNTVTAVSLSTFSSAPTGTVDTFTNAQFTLGLHLTDVTSGQSGDLSFTGVFNGTLSPTISEIKTSFLGATSKQLTLGQNTYTVALDSVQAPGLPDATSFGYINADVSINSSTGSTGTGSGNGGTGNGGGGVTVQTVPEPSTLLLAGLALPAGLTWWRMRRRPTAGD